LVAVCTTAQKDKIEQPETQKTTSSSEQTTESSRVNSKADCVTMKFRYLVRNDYMSTPKMRYVDIFMDEKAFSEENLKTLFDYLSDKYTGPEDLTMVVVTNWNQLPLPTDCPPSGISGLPDKPDKYDYHQAIFHRRGINKYFRYNPVLKSSIFKKVIMYMEPPIR
jgi:hypothetical protein